jgi:hypothetical protein
MESLGLEIKEVSIEDQQIVILLNGLIRKMSILLFGCERQVFQILKSYGVE